MPNLVKQAMVFRFCREFEAGFTLTVLWRKGFYMVVDIQPLIE
jgi:hypothetical protein